MTKFELNEPVVYTRFDGTKVHGLVERTAHAYSAVYIFNTATGDIVAAPASRVERGV
jgi:hypothetical protein